MGVKWKSRKRWFHDKRRLFTCDSSCHLFLTSMISYFTMKFLILLTFSQFPIFCMRLSSTRWKQINVIHCSFLPEFSFFFLFIFMQDYKELLKCVTLHETKWRKKTMHKKFSLRIFDECSFFHDFVSKSIWISKDSFILSDRSVAQITLFVSLQ